MKPEKDCILDVQKAFHREIIKVDVKRFEDRQELNTTFSFLKEVKIAMQNVTHQFLDGAVLDHQEPQLTDLKTMPKHTVDFYEMNWSFSVAKFSKDGQYEDPLLLSDFDCIAINIALKESAVRIKN